MNVHSKTTYKNHTIKESGIYEAYGFRVYDPEFIATVNTEPQAKALIDVLVEAKTKTVKGSLKPTVMLVEKTNGDLIFKFCHQPPMKQFERFDIPNSPFWIGCKKIYTVWQSNSNLID